MAALDTETSCWSNRYSTSALHFAEPFCVNGPGEFVLPPYEAPALQSSERQRLRPERRRPLTFHAGWSRTHDDERALLPEGHLDVYTYEDSAVSVHISGPTIASIRCEEDAAAPSSSNDERPAMPPMPELRLDTTCGPAPSTASPLALVSNFLDTLAGLVHSPVTPSASQPSRTDNAIMIFDSAVFVDMLPRQEQDVFDELNIPTTSAWATPTMDWESWAPHSGLHKAQAGPSEQFDELTTMERDSLSMDMASLVWC